MDKFGTHHLNIFKQVYNIFALVKKQPLMRNNHFKNILNYRDLLWENNVVE